MLSKLLKETLVCTWCLGRLEEGEATLTCTKCKAVYAIQDGIPNMLLDAARLFCPVCRRELKKGEGAAQCGPCDRVFSLRERIKL